MLHARIIQALKARYDAMWEALPEAERRALEGRAPRFDGPKLLAQFTARIEQARKKRRPT